MGCSTSVKAGGYKRVCKEGPVFDAKDIAWGGNF
jgi:NAD(P)H-flavin reductase